MTNKPTLGDLALIQRFAAYYRNHRAWGSLHVVLDDGNVHTDHVTFCREVARDTGDLEGETLAELLLLMSRTQRLKLPHKVRAALREADLGESRTSVKPIVVFIGSLDLTDLELRDILYHYGPMTLGAHSLRHSDGAPVMAGDIEAGTQFDLILNRVNTPALRLTRKPPKPPALTARAQSKRFRAR